MTTAITACSSSPRHLKQENFKKYTVESMSELSPTLEDDVDEQKPIFLR
jgi:hypothetical protein